MNDLERDGIDYATGRDRRLSAHVSPESARAEKAGDRMIEVMDRMIQSAGRTRSESSK